MGWDIYCALCGGPFENHGILPDDGHEDYPEGRNLNNVQLHNLKYRDAWDSDEDWWLCDTSVLAEYSIAWLKDVRAIGRVNGKAFVTGVGVEWPSGSVSVDPGDDTNVPTPNQLNPAVQPGRLYIDAYHVCYGPQSHPLFPLHTKCFGVLEEVQKYRSRNDESAALDLELLYQVAPELKSYGEFKESIDQIWCGGSPSLEPWYHDPLDVPVLNALDEATKQRRVRVWARGCESPANCLSDLPAEILVLITDHLTAQSVIQLTRTCRNVNAVLNKNFWKRRLLRDMPYLFEIRQKVKEHPPGGAVIDWRDLYGRMMLQSYPGHWNRVWWKFTDPARELPSNADVILEYLGGHGHDGLLKRGNMVSRFDPRLIGIASRQRVWKCAEELLDICEKYALQDDWEGPDTV